MLTVRCVQAIEGVNPALQASETPLSQISVQQLSERGLLFPPSADSTIDARAFTTALENLLRLPQSSHSELLAQLFEGFAELQTGLLLPTRGPPPTEIERAVLLGALSVISNGSPEIMCRAIFAALSDSGAAVALEMHTAALALGISRSALDVALTASRLKADKDGDPRAGTKVAADVGAAPAAGSRRGSVQGGSSRRASVSFAADPPLVADSTLTRLCPVGANGDPLDALLHRGQKLMQMLDQCIDDEPLPEMLGGLGGITSEDTTENELLSRLLHESTEEEDNRLINEFIGADELKEPVRRCGVWCMVSAGCDRI